MSFTSRGFTIVELLVVIVIIAILAAIAVTTFRGVQNRAQDTARISDVKAIQRALEVYKADKGSYPVTTASPLGACSTLGSGYSYSFATDDSWMRVLETDALSFNAPVPAKNDCTSYYRYLYRAPGTVYGCTLTTGYYVLQVFGAAGAVVPSDSASFKPCPASTVTWGATSTIWTFGKFENE